MAEQSRDDLREALARCLAQEDGWQDPAALWTDNVAVIERGGEGDPVWWLYRDEANALLNGPLSQILSDLTEARALAQRAGEERDRAVAECEALRADKARLDFLDRCNAALNAHYGVSYGWRLILSGHITRLARHGGLCDIDLYDNEPKGPASCREAIDGEMSRIRAARPVIEHTEGEDADLHGLH